MNVEKGWGWLHPQALWISEEAKPSKYKRGLFPTQNPALILRGERKQRQTRPCLMEAPGNTDSIHPGLPWGGGGRVPEAGLRYRTAPGLTREGWRLLAVLLGMGKGRTGTHSYTCTCMHSHKCVHPCTQICAHVCTYARLLVHAWICVPAHTRPTEHWLPKCLPATAAPGSP